MSNAVAERRCGRLEISRKALYDASDEVLSELFGHLIVLRAEHEFLRDVFVYHCASPCFRKVPVSEIAPQYCAEFTQFVDSSGAQRVAVQFSEVRE